MSATQALHDEILELENSVWEVQTKPRSGPEMQRFLSADCLMLFPGTKIISATSEPSLRDVLLEDIPPWSYFKLKDVHVIPLGPEAACISYAVRAERGEDDYRALVSSVWRNSGEGWKMVMHQQTIDRV